MKTDSIQNNTLLQAALTYAEQGYAVFPCRPKDKVPLISGGFKNASRDAEQIRSWWATWPQANIGLPTGKDNGIVVLDFDEKAGGLQTLEAMLQAGELPDTRVHATGGGGFHYVYAYPEIAEVRNKARIRPGLDVRGEGGYIIAPPSIHASGNPYKFTAQSEILSLPQELMVELAESKTEQHEEAINNAEVLEGGRNDYLTRVAGALQRRGLSPEALSAALQAENEAKCSPPLPADEVERIAVWAATKEASAPILANSAEGKTSSSVEVKGFSVSDDMLFFVQEKEGKQDATSKQTLIPVASRLDIVASTSDIDSHSWGKLVEFSDPKGHRHRIPIANEEMSTGSMRYRQALADAGLAIFAPTSGRDYLSEYIKKAKPSKHITCTSRVGWHQDSFVLPYRSFNTSGQEIVLQGNLHASEELKQFEQKGTLKEWQDNVAALCEGNSRLELAVSAGFAAPLLYLLEEESGGFHLKGSSSTGKTTALRVAASLYGKGSMDGYIYSWRTTDNALEGRTLARCDCLLLLDELSQIDPRLAGGIAYQLANGQAKGRQSKTGSQRKTAKWRVLFISTGEISLADHMALAGQVTKAGQDIRMIDIPAETVMGLFENIHCYATPAEFAQTISRNAQNHYGTAIAVFLERLAADKEGAVARVKELRKQFLAMNPIPENASGQVERVAQRFALVAAAGELAIEWGVVKWNTGAALRGASKCFEAWMTQRGGAEDIEEIKGIESVKSFLLTQEARFLDSKSSPDRLKPHNIAGWKRSKGGNQDDFDWLVYRDPFRKEACRGYNPDAIARALKERGFLKTSPGKLTYSTSVPGNKSTRVYYIQSNIFNEGPPDGCGTGGGVDIKKNLETARAWQLKESTPAPTPIGKGVEPAKGAV